MERVRKKSKRPKKINALQWVLDLISDEETFDQRAMFGGQVAYLHGRLVMTVMDRGIAGEPWNGLLIPTDRKDHGSLLEDWPDLAPHPVLGKWLYLSQSHPQFESLVEELAQAIAGGDIRIGIEPGRRTKQFRERIAKKHGPHSYPAGSTHPRVSRRSPGRPRSGNA